MYGTSSARSAAPSTRPRRPTTHRHPRQSDHPASLVLSFLVLCISYTWRRPSSWKPRSLRASACPSRVHGPLAVFSHRCYHGASARRQLSTAARAGAGQLADARPQAYRVELSKNASRGPLACIVCASTARLVIARAQERGRRRRCAGRMRRVRTGAHGHAMATAFELDATACFADCRPRVGAVVLLDRRPSLLTFRQARAGCKGTKVCLDSQLERAEPSAVQGHQDRQGRCVALDLTASLTLRRDPLRVRRHASLAD